MRLAHTMIRVNDLEESLEFYRDFLGLTETRRKALGEEATLVFLEDGTSSHQIELTWNQSQNDYTLGDQFGHLAFHTEDLESIVEQVKSRGWWFRRSRPEATSKYIFIKDPNGYDIEILERTKSHR